MRCLDLVPAARGLPVSSPLLSDLGPSLEGRSYSSASDLFPPLCQKDSASFKRRLFSGRSLAMNSSSSLDISLTPYIDAENVFNVSCERCEFVDVGLPGTLKRAKSSRRAKTFQLACCGKHVQALNGNFHDPYSDTIHVIFLISSKRFITTRCSD